LKLLADVFPSASISDYRLYFSGTLVRCTTPDDTTPTWRWWGSIGDNSVVEIHDFKSRGAKIFHTSDLRISSYFPASGLRNFRSSVVCINRKTKRQNNKGVSSSTMNIWNFYDAFAGQLPSGATKGLPNRANSNDIKDWNQILNHSEYIDFDAGISALFKEEAIARAFSRDFFASLGITGDSPELWFRTFIIGSVESSSKIRVRVPSFYQEAHDFFSPMGISVEVA
jgi:hypothetical protein